MDAAASHERPAPLCPSLRRVPFRTFRIFRTDCAFLELQDVKTLVSALMERRMFDTTHPKFRSALVVFIDQIWSAILQMAVPGTVFTVMLTSVLRTPLRFLFPNLPYLPDVLSGSVIYLQWYCHQRPDTRYETDEDLANGLRIDPRFRAVACFLLSISALSCTYYVLQTWLGWNTLWWICVVGLVVVAGIAFGLGWWEEDVGPRRWKVIQGRLNLLWLRVTRHALRPLLFGVLRVFDEARDALERYRKIRAENTVLAARPPQGVLFQHTPIKSPSTHFRLLKLNVGIEGLACSLVVEPIETTICYKAISWMWDPLEERGTNSLKIDGRELGISPTIYRVITQLAPVFGTRYLWIDAICIDQTDPRPKDQVSQTGRPPERPAKTPSEKEHQIPLMTTIYRGAHRVIAFPGVDEREDLAAGFIGDLALYMSMRRSPLSFLQLDRSDHFPYRERRESWKAFFGLVQQPFWTRAWIIQEMVVAKSVTIRYGRSEIPFDVLGPLVMLFKMPEEGVTPIFVRDEGLYNRNFRGGKFGIDFIGRLYGLHETYRAGPGEAACVPLSTGRMETVRCGMLSLPDLLVECAQSEATMAHDKVWALCGLIRDPEWNEKVKALQPDYSLPVKELYKQVALAILTHGGDRHLALFGVAGKNNPDDDGAPSWVPGLSQLPVLYPMDNLNCGYEAGGAGGEIPSLIGFDGKEGAIVLQGLVIDTVKRVDNTNPHTAYRGGPSPEEIPIQRMAFLGSPESLREEHARKMQAWLLEIREMAGASRYQAHNNDIYLPTEEPLDQAILRTLICDDDIMSFPASSDTIQELDLYLFKYLCNIDEYAGTVSSAMAILQRAEGRFAQAQQLLSSQKTFGLVMKRTKGRQFAVSDWRRLLMIVPSEAEKGDVIVIFPGARVPHLLRPVKGAEGRYTLVGEAYVHGIMRGECFRESREDDICRWNVPVERFCIV